MSLEALWSISEQQKCVEDDYSEQGSQKHLKPLRARCYLEISLEQRT